MSFYKRADGIWQWDRRRKGERVTIASGDRNKKTGWKKVKDELAVRALPYPSGTQDAERLSAVRPVIPAGMPRTPLGPLSEKYLLAAKKRIRVKANYDAHEKRVRYMVERLGRDRELFSLTEDDLEPIAQEFETEENPRRPRTINAYIVETIRPMFAFAHKNLKRPHPCMVDWQSVIRPEDNTRCRYLTKDEMTRLLAALPDRDGHLHQFAWITGFRVMEIINLRWSDIDWENRIITTKVKGGWWRTMPLTGRIEALLRDLEPDKHPEFVFSFKAVFTIPERGMEAGKRYKFSYQHLYHRMKVALQAAGIEDYRFHDHRHTAATLLFLATGKIRLVQALLGHRCISSCDRYIHFGTKDLGREMERIDAQDLPHAVMADLLARANLEPEDGWRMEDVLRDNIRLLRRLADLERRNQALEAALAAQAA